MLLNVGQVPRFHDAIRRGRTFFACNSALQALSVNSATATGLVLTNPAASGFNLEILQISIAIASAPAAQANLILTGTLLTTAAANTTHTTPLVVKNALIGSAFAVGVGLCDSAATVPTPAALRAIGGGPAATGSVNTAYICDNLDGIITLAPGCVISLQAMTTAITVVASIVWEESPI